MVIAKYADHLPLYRQAQIYGRQGVELDRSTLADWSGRAAFALRPVYERLFDVLKGSDKLFADETRAPVLDPGRRKTKTGQLWAYARDDRPWGGPEPPGVAYSTSPTASTSVPPRIWLASLDRLELMTASVARALDPGRLLEDGDVLKARARAGAGAAPGTVRRSKGMAKSAASTPSNCAISRGLGASASGWPPPSPRPDRSSRR